MAFCIAKQQSVIKYNQRSVGGSVSTTSSYLSSESSSVSSVGSKRVNVVFTNEQFEELQHLASSQNISLEDALRQAIGLASLVVNANPNTRILFKTGDSVQELKLVR